jgi:hypothetical protein
VGLRAGQNGEHEMRQANAPALPPPPSQLTPPHKPLTLVPLVYLFPFVRHTHWLRFIPNHKLTHWVHA